jgi:hypothetical protein
MKKVDLLIENFHLAGVRDVIIDVTLRHEFHGSCPNLERNGEPSHPDENGALDARDKLVLGGAFSTLGRCEGQSNDTRNVFSSFP